MKNTSVPQMAEGKRAGQRKPMPLLKSWRKGLEKHDERGFLSPRLSAAAALSAAGGEAVLGDERYHPKPQSPAAGNQTCTLLS